MVLRHVLRPFCVEQPQGKCRDVEVFLFSDAMTS